MGRKTTYDEEIAAKICERIANGETLRAICRDESDYTIPAWRTVYAWLDANKDFAARFMRARRVGADAIAQQALDIADTPEEGVIEIDKENINGPYTEVRRADMLDHRKLRIETRLKLLAKWHPDLYGERLNIGNADGEPFKFENVDHIEPGDLARVLWLLPRLRERSEGKDDGSDLV